MRIFSVWLLICLLLGHAGHGQVIREASDTTSLAQDLRAAFSTLNSNRLSTGILMDQIPAFSAPHNYDGTAAAAVNSYTNWMQQYWEYY